MAERGSIVFQGGLNILECWFGCALELSDD